MALYEVCIRINKYHEPSLAVVFNKQIDAKYVDSDICYRGRYYYTSEDRATKKLDELCTKC